MITLTKNDHGVSIFRIDNLIKVRGTLLNRKQKLTSLRCEHAVRKSRKTYDDLLIGEQKMLLVTNEDKLHCKDIF